jgi:hypothetical protein
LPAALGFAGVVAGGGGRGEVHGIAGALWARRPKGGRTRP